MSPIIERILQELNSSVFVLLLILAAIGYGLFKIGGWKEKFRHHDEKLGKLDSMDAKLSELSFKVQLIYDNTNPRKLVAAHSPLALTALGHDLAGKIRAEEIFARLMPGLLDAIEKKCPQDTNAYDIQLEALDIAKNTIPTLLTAEEINTIKNAAFAMGILLDDIWTIFGVYLRDEILKKRNIPFIEIDRHDPTRQEK